MTKHFMISSLETGNHLIAKSAHDEAIAMLTAAMNSKVMADIDMTSPGLPKGCQAMSADDDFWPHPQDWFASMRPYKVTAEGILVIPVRGVLLHGVSITLGRYFTGYEYLVRAVMRGRDDGMVKGILFHIDSPGGHVAGCFDLCDFIDSLEKPTVAICADMAASAAYAIAASCKKIAGTQTCDVGNIGVLATFIDVSKMLDSQGVKFEYVSAPENGFKADGHYGTAISKEILERTQLEVNETYEIFVACVARNRPMTPDQIRETKALSYRKDASLSMGLIDMVASSVDIPGVAGGLFASFGEEPGQGEETAIAPIAEKETDMTEDEKKALADTARAEGATAATARISAILASPEAEGREEQAKFFAFSTAIDAETAINALKVAPKATAPVADNTDDKSKNNDLSKSFDSQMQKHSPNLSPDGNDDGQPDDAETKAKKSHDASMSLAKRAGMVGYNFDAKN